MSAKGNTIIIDEAYQKAIAALKLCITPKGFSACSITHDREKKTNYNSVWSRDSALTSLWTLPLNDPDFTDAARRSLATILDAQADNGTLPNYIFVNSDYVEYGGLANICSIDGALLIIIAAWNYYEHTNDQAFLRKYTPHIEKTYKWLAAHDSNNCGLLEVPESSDWADLMYRSYNVLYDEVLWYAATLAYEKWQKAAGNKPDLPFTPSYIKEKILFNFWPTEEAAETLRPSHAMSQFRLVRTPYLIEQTGPHYFGWRCDVYANLLAALYDVVDDQQKEDTYYFLRAVEIDKPFPVRVLYPPVNPGDPLWRDYKLVKIHNIPNHYHNGGIWPLVGGLWVRYLLQIGQKDHAGKALHALAEFCRQGIVDEWEFNEWGHGVTGKPMGKAYQAWSAASYIAAYQAFAAAG